MCRLLSGLRLFRYRFYYLLCHLKRWVQVSFIRLLYWWSIQTKLTPRFALLFILLVTFWLTLGINSVSAQEATVTPSPTWQPLFPSRTPRPTINSACPEGLPDGWLTVTPSSKWMGYCGECVYGEAVRPTGDWSDFEVTPFPEEYITHLGNCTLEELDDGCEIISWPATGGVACQCLGYPTPTPGITPTTTTEHYFINDVPYDHVQIITSGINISATRPINTTGICGTNAYISAIGSKNNLWYGSYNGTSYGEAWIGNNGYSKWKLYDTIGGSDAQGIGYVCQSTATLWEFETCSIFNNLTGWSSALALNLRTDMEISVGQYSQNGYAANEAPEIKVLCYGIETQAPTATPDTGADYCAVVEARPEFLADEIGLSLPIPVYGAGECVQIGGWSIDISWLEAIFPNLFTFNMPDSLGVPGFILCIHPFLMGEFNLFGLMIDMDLLLYVTACIAIIRWLARS